MGTFIAGDAGTRTPKRGENSMKLHTTRGRLLASTMIFGVVALATPTLAQTTAAQQTAADNNTAPTVVVTGTLFRTRTETAAPVTVYDGQEDRRPRALPT